MSESISLYFIDYGSTQANGVIHGKKSTGVESDGMIETVLLFLYYRPMFD